MRPQRGRSFPPIDFLCCLVEPERTQLLHLCDWSQVDTQFGVDGNQSWQVRTIEREIDILDFLASSSAVLRFPSFPLRCKTPALLLVVLPTSDHHRSSACLVWAFGQSGRRKVSRVRSAGQGTPLIPHPAWLILSLRDDSKEEYWY